MSAFDPTSGATLQPNARYWGSKPAVQRISWKFFSSETSQAIAFRAGQIDLAFPDDNRTFASTSGASLVSAPGDQVVGTFTMNTLVAPWNDEHVRLAVAYALDRADLISAYGGYAQATNTLLQPSMLEQLGSRAAVSSALKSVPSYGHNLTLAKAEMSKSKYGHGANVTLGVLNTPSFVNASQAVIAQLSKIGIHAKLRVEQTAAWTAEFTGSDRPAIPAQFVTATATSDDPGSAFGYLLGSSNASAGNWNATNYSTPSIDQLLATGLTTVGKTERLGIYRQLLTEYGQAVPFIPLFTADVTLALAKSYTWPTFNGQWRNSGPWALGIGRA